MHSFLSNLVSPDGWFKRVTFDETVSDKDLIEHLFTHPCIQLDFPSSLDFDYIKSILLSVASKRGECLNYNNSSPFLRLPDYSNQPVEMHFDGISNSDPSRIPDWIFFLHSIPHASSFAMDNFCGFSISNCHLALSYLETKLQKQIFDLSEIILNHLVGSSDTSHNICSDLEIPLISTLPTRIPVLRGHFPLKDTYNCMDESQSFYCYPDKINICFKTLEWSKQKHLLENIIYSLSRPDTIYNHQFNTHSILAVHNKSCFHSTKSVISGDHLRVERLQLIDE